MASPLGRLIDRLKEAGKKIGRTMDPAPSFKPWAEAAGFVGVEEQRFRLPVGSWPKDPRFKEIGEFLGFSLYDGVEAFTAVPFRDVLNRSQEEVEVLNASVRRMVRHRDIHPIFDFLVVTGMKPLVGR
ncbi:Malonyl-[acyl-carrier protein] O-methyltransferase 1 [Tolypocladium capitatum]|uniref:Malonyl-[acyl-carrier protein] O-methyltransferase 1 n=1 Tax=Tolypocladium capitatum TaxID=45235 RepID=A0A2K3Q921_9HYPO|nr:Malonyl-[acyl-carrier protein] O-methyltransferase 1 [Tolypocladium capitatum]